MRSIFANEEQRCFRLLQCEGVVYLIDIVERVKTNERNSIKTAFPVSARRLKARASVAKAACAALSSPRRRASHPQAEGGLWTPEIKSGIARAGGLGNQEPSAYELC